MIQTEDNVSRFFEGDFSIKIVFDENKNTFEEFEEIFKFLDQFDKLYYQFSVQKSYKRNGGDYKRSNVLSISKNSPLEISVFIEKKWFEILLFLLSTNRETIILNLKQNYQDFEKLIDSVEEMFLEVAENFQGFDREVIINFLHWFDSMTVDQKFLIVQFLRRSQKVMKKFRRIFKV